MEGKLQMQIVPSIAAVWCSRRLLLAPLKPCHAAQSKAARWTTWESRCEKRVEHWRHESESECKTYTLKPVADAWLEIHPWLNDALSLSGFLIQYIYSILFIVFPQPNFAVSDHIPWHQHVFQRRVQSLCVLGRSGLRDQMSPVTKTPLSSMAKLFRKSLGRWKGHDAKTFLS